MSPKGFMSSNHSEVDVSRKLEKMRSILHADDLVSDPWFLADEYLLFWLEEKKMNVRKAVKRFRETMMWRQEQDVENIAYDEKWMNTIFQYVGLNSEGGPIFMNRPVAEERVGEKLLDEDKHAMRKVIIFQMERVLAIMKEIGNYKPATLVVDGSLTWMAGDLRQLDLPSLLAYPQLRSSATMFCEGYELYKTRYAGMLKDVYIVNVPSSLRKTFTFVTKPYIRADILAKVKTYGFKREKWMKDLTKVMKKDDIDELLPPVVKPRH